MYSPLLQTSIKISFAIYQAYLHQLGILIFASHKYVLQHLPLYYFLVMLYNIP